MKKIKHLVSFLLFFNTPLIDLQSQNLGIDFLAGPQFSYLNYNKRSLDYKTISNNDLRFGISFGDFEKISSSVLIGKTNFKSQYTSEDITSNIEFGYTTIDVPIRYHFQKVINSISIGPSFLLRNYSSQTTNNLSVHNNRMFKPTVFAIYSEVVFKGWEISVGNINPFIFYRQSIGGVEESHTDESTNIHQFGMGLKAMLPCNI
jgi:hypothetical protein